MNAYEVGVRWEKKRMIIEAKSAAQAKRIWCKMKGRRYDDPWCGASILEARKIPADRVPPSAGRGEVM